MQHDTYQVGAVLGGRYQIEGILGRGGFSVVYLVRDQGAPEAQEPGTPQPRFALKVLTTQEKQACARFLAEGHLLARLDHPALPRVHHVFEEEDAHRAGIVMDYVEGTNLDLLRKQQATGRLSLSEALEALAPVVAVLSYLHAQPLPIIHRDIKPTNLIVQSNGKGTVLVDFGIAKEYEQDATTEAMRHCTPGYGAPEQYSSIGTDQRTDIYSLAATLYVLLTGTVPVDALHRATQLASKQKDPLVPVQQLNPDIPVPVARTIARAMSIGMEKRFMSVEEFWLALQEASRQQTQAYAAQQAASRRKVWFTRNPDPLSLPLRLTSKSRLLRLRPVPWVLVLLLIGGGLVGLRFVAQAEAGTPRVAPTQQAAIVIPTVRVTEGLYPVLATSYQGTMLNVSANVKTAFRLTHLHQTQEQMSGLFNRQRLDKPLMGVLDSSRHIFFTVATQPALFFEGVVRFDGNLVGNYCAIDATGQCVGEYGVWSLVSLTGEHQPS